jgi:hypothetical protein
MNNNYFIEGNHYCRKVEQGVEFELLIYFNPFKYNVNHFSLPAMRVIKQVFYDRGSLHYYAI